MCQPDKLLIQIFWFSNFILQARGSHGWFLRGSLTWSQLQEFLNEQLLVLFCLIFLPYSSQCLHTSFFSCQQSVVFLNFLLAKHSTLKLFSLCFPLYRQKLVSETVSSLLLLSPQRGHLQWMGFISRFPNAVGNTGPRVRRAGFWPWCGAGLGISPL